MRVLSLLVVVSCGASCVLPPSCVHRVFGFPRSSPKTGHFATLTIFADPIEDPLERRYSTGVGMWERFERGASITIDSRGRMAVSGLDLWPERCPHVSEGDLVEVSRSWQPVLEQIVRLHTDIQVMANPYTGADDWQPDGPLLSLSFGSASDKNLGLLWDGRSRLPRELDAAVLETLEMFCSNSRLAKRYLFRDLPSQVTRRLECQ